MINAFKFSNWNQLAGLKSSVYPNLQIHVTQFNSEELIGTKIDIVDTRNQLVYFSAFNRVVQSSVFDPLAVYEVPDIIKRINAYGFNISITDPITLPPNVITMLEGLLALGYNYLTLQYIRDTKTSEKTLYQTDLDSDSMKDWEEHYLPPPYKVFSNKYIVVTKDLGDVTKNRIRHRTQPVKDTYMYIISQSPDFNWEDFKWVQPTRVYSIELLVHPKENSISFLEDSIINIGN